MTKINLAQLSIKTAHGLLQNGEISARELLEFYGSNIKKNEKNLHAYLEIFDDAYEQASEIDKQIKSGLELPLLAGIPMAIKDNILIKGKKCSAGSKILEGFSAPYSATVIKKLRKEGAVFLGRTNMDEFAMGASTEHSAFGPTKNPYNTACVPGGTSGGSAVAVASQECLVALGSDTGGSVRQPASFCGVVGLKPTYGAVSRYGLIAFASSFDQIGPLAKTVEDAEIIFNAIRGRDKMDSTSIDGSPASAGKSDFIVGIPKEFFDLEGKNDGVDEDVVLKFREAVEIFKDLGFQIKQVSLPASKYSLEVYYIITPAEASSNLARFDGVKYGFYKSGKDLLADYMETRGHGFGDEPRRRILLGTYVLSAGYYDEYYSRAQKVRNAMKEDFKKVFKEVDVILSPTAPTTAFKLGENTEDPLKMYLADIYTCSANLIGVPAMSLPAGFSEKEGGKMPVGIQLMSPWFKEEYLFALGKIFEKNI